MGKMRYNYATSCYVKVIDVDGVCHNNVELFESPNKHILYVKMDGVYHFVNYVPGKLSQNDDIYYLVGHICDEGQAIPEDWDKEFPDEKRRLLERSIFLDYLNGDMLIINDKVRKMVIEAYRTAGRTFEADFIAEYERVKFLDGHLELISNALANHICYLDQRTDLYGIDYKHKKFLFNAGMWQEVERDEE